MSDQISFFECGFHFISGLCCEEYQAWASTGGGFLTSTLFDDRV